MVDCYLCGKVLGDQEYWGNAEMMASHPACGRKLERRRREERCEFCGKTPDTVPEKMRHAHDTCRDTMTYAGF